MRHGFTSFRGWRKSKQTLNGLITHEPEPLVVRLPRQPGQKEVRFAHLLSGEIDVEALVAESERASVASPSRRSGSEQIERLEQKVDALTAEVETLKEQFEQFRKQFE